MQIKKILKFIKRKVKEAGARGVVVGLSGGVDSAVVTALCKTALGRKKVTALIIPESETPQEDVADAVEFAKKIGVRYYIVDFSNVYKEFGKVIPIFDEKALIPNGNLKARIRMCILYYFANRKKLLVAGTGNRSELLMGYFTRYGDGGVDFLPIGRLYKTDVAKLARKLGIPNKIIEKKPSPGLWRGQTAEGELGIPYVKLDEVLKRLKFSDSKIAKEVGLSEAKVRGVRKRIKLMKFKCEMPEVA
ncbi:MAG: NAD+ synthase [Candidatus Micrarchaeia archaeon]